ncbi:DUF2695 domain-containing protein [Nocardioides pantholopis]|uniref:DUF2695 domain-containing protein n=1 Tax=Nocardioides pantholopis TaxID=2483798 RepID=UPI000F0953BC|nr:DUF2695 domain-containing protein [Nocardioides pantholopis]
MTDTTIAAEAEGLVQALAEELTTPRPGECLACFVLRMLDDFGCDETPRFALRFRDLRAPRATALRERLGSMGAFCDCEIFLNGLTASARRRRYDADGEELAPEAPRCAGVRRGSTQACEEWDRRPWWS